MVGAIARVARVRSTPGPATELIMTVECENKAARVRHKLYEWVKASAERKVSELLKRCAAGSAVMSDPTAAARFCCVNSTISAGLPTASCQRNTTVGAFSFVVGNAIVPLCWSWTSSCQTEMSIFPPMPSGTSLQPMCLLDVSTVQIIWRTPEPPLIRSASGREPASAISASAPVWIRSSTSVGCGWLYGMRIGVKP
jgi:hypothetical protein